MHVYIFEYASGEELTVFAESFDQAAELFVIHRWLQGIKDESFAIRRALREVKDRQREHMIEAMRRREIGIGRYDPNEGYTVVPVIDAGEEGTGAPWDNIHGCDK